ncbi:MULTISPECIES: DHH family phosphoesterase [unclassified Blautia]|uniref:DHH family phosphoesterase n=1 Tax=unclassified Blautia TaxID=2648079 RepID=UPI000B37BE41|nr:MULTISPECIES: DHH family phosphoesterase [unclassified Blautia]OUN26478.1 DHH family phosphoesterase [Blautia sp. An81]OUN90597.1 DHH family phosphoesterase [Blautia sp. An46]
MDGKIKIKGQLKFYMQWPMILTVLLVFMDILVFTVDRKAGGLVSIFVAAYVLIVVFLYFHSRAVIMNELISFATQYGQVQKTLLKEFIVPYALLDYNGKILWMNDAFAALSGKNRRYRKSVTNLFPELTKDKLPTEREAEVTFQYEEKDYRAVMRPISIQRLLEESGLVEPEGNNDLTALYLFDETELNQYIRQKEDEKLVTGLLYLDNYEEALNSVEEVRRSLLVALIERKLNKYFGEVDGLIKKLEKDKFILVMRQRSLEELKKKRFNILEDVKTVNIGNDMAVTISIGIGINAPSYSQNYEYARIAIDLALGRGGDQVVIKDRDQMTYFGGKSQQMGKSTRVKARVKAHALREFMVSKDKVVVMGHKIPDVDSIGAGIGIYRAAKSLNKKTHIVVNNPTMSVRPIIQTFKDNPDYDENMFISSDEARDIVDDNTVVVVVDTNKPSYTECEDLLHMSKTIVVLDHHRQGSEVIQNAVLSYIEPYASSACEMVAEILQYFSDDIRIYNIEADALYSGIIIDTNNFTSKTGVRTFEAAAFLRRCGADVTRVRKMFRDDLQSYRAKAEAIRHVETYKGCFAIAVCPTEGVDSPTVVASQAANELLNIDSVKATFVLTDYQNKIFISARAIDEINVQLVMERMGGGGHINMAGAQLPGATVEEAIAQLKETLDQMIHEGDIEI